MRGEANEAGGTPLPKKLGVEEGAKVAAADDTWSGLKLVVRRELRG